jgi:hypothetical protein
MAMWYGVAAFGAGTLLAARERAAFWAAARSALALGLLLTGAILFLVGLSERRAQAIYKDATQNDPDAKPA